MENLEQFLNFQMHKTSNFGNVTEKEHTEKI